MPWCPTCRGEYREGIATCPTCNVALVAELEEEPEEIDDAALADSDAELALIARADFGTCLEMRAALASERIPCLLVREPQDPAATRAQQRAAPVDLYVEVGRVEDAARVLHAKWQGLLQNEGLEPAAPAT